ncbi:MAG: hypothetical protein ACTHN5_13165 [Phycisphaerae bacterium]
MAAQVTVAWWKANEPKLTKHAEWERDVVPALASWESFRKNVEGSSAVANDYVKLKQWGDHLTHVIKAKHDWLNPVVHRETRKKLEELLGVLNTQMQAYVIKFQEFKATEERNRATPRTVNTGRPLPKLPPSKNDVLTKLEQRSRGG